jgi:hypothetical protein
LKLAASFGIASALVAYYLRIMALHRSLSFVYSFDEAPLTVNERHTTLDKEIVGRLVEHLNETLPIVAHVSLLADGQAKSQYAQYGFRKTAPNAVGNGVAGAGGLDFCGLVQITGFLSFCFAARARLASLPHLASETWGTLIFSNCLRENSFHDLLPSRPASGGEMQLAAAIWT